MAKTAPRTMDLDYSIHYRHWHSESPEHVRAMVDSSRRFLERHLPPGPNGTGPRRRMRDGLHHSCLPRTWLQ